MSNKRGWAILSNTRKYHYFDTDQTVSLCGRWLMWGYVSRDDSKDDHPENCVSCRKKKAKLDSQQEATKPDDDASTT